MNTRHQFHVAVERLNVPEAPIVWVKTLSGGELVLSIDLRDDRGDSHGIDLFFATGRVLDYVEANAADEAIELLAAQLQNAALELMGKAQRRIRERQEARAIDDDNLERIRS